MPNGHEGHGGVLNANVLWYPGVGTGTGHMASPGPGTVLQRTPPLVRGYYRWKVRIWTSDPFIYVFQRMNADGTLQQDAPGYDHVFVRPVPADSHPMAPPGVAPPGHWDFHCSEDDLYFMDNGDFFRLLVADASYVGGTGSPTPAHVFASLAVAYFTSGSPLR